MSTGSEAGGEEEAMGPESVARARYFEEGRLLAEREAKDLTELFTHSRLWECEKTLGNGSYGVALLMKNKSTFDRNPKRVVLKRGIRRKGADSLVHEMRFIQMMRGHAHIGQMVDSHEDVHYIRHRPGRLAKIARRVFGKFENPPQNIFKHMSSRRGPALILEYLENGSLMSFIEKSRGMNITLPNRILWAWFYCLMRAGAALTQENLDYRGGPLILEELANLGDDSNFCPLRHNDVAPRNVMISNTEPEVPEHQLVPKLVLIDFGVARFDDSAFNAQSRNVYDLCSLWYA
ncbi:hypothetical protein F4808DRAFT_3006 [Astrocystis sublimbata]|nr:hypothetical protein F4808DRAFT_3006 [Astrocystis sublimbata]